MKKSTKVMIKKHGWRVDRAIHNYIYFVFYYPYVKVVLVFLGLLKYLTWFKPLKSVGDFVFNRYHAKVLSVSDTQKIFTLNEDVRVISEQNKRVVPFKYATKILFKEPEYIAVMDCPCKKSCNVRGDINSCIAVGKDLSTFWLEHCQHYNARKITQEEAFNIIKRFRKTGHITQVFMKVATGGSTGLICNCHPDSCVSLIASKITKKIDSNLSQSAQSGYSVVHDVKKCKTCGTCADICPVDVIEVRDVVWTYNKDECLGCELCVEHCPNGALSLYQDPDKLLPLDLDMIKERFV
ncbi:MAG: 4Fe-4S binding protein [Thermodesulfobacteriota bacterium]|nr:4Fe-4S binding protein [Thermodesulfobacteriota bacterium]